MERRKEEMTPRNAFEKSMVDKNIDSAFLSKRWGKTVRRINQVRCMPRLLHIDAINGIPKQRSKKSAPDLEFDQTLFEVIMVEKDIDAPYLSKRWNIGVRRVNQIRKSPCQIHIDAILGVPKYCKNNNYDE